MKKFYNLLVVFQLLMMSACGGNPDLMSYYGETPKAIKDQEKQAEKADAQFRAEMDKMDRALGAAPTRDEESAQLDAYINSRLTRPTVSSGAGLRAISGADGIPYPRDGISADRLEAYFEGFAELGDPIQQVEKINLLLYISSEFEKNRDIETLEPSGRYIRKRLEQDYIDVRGIIKTVTDVEYFPEVTLLTDRHRPEGLLIREAINTTLASESVILEACSLIAGGGAGADPCQEFREWSGEFHSVLFLGDRLGSIWAKKEDFRRIYSKHIEPSVQFLKDYAKGVLSSAVEFEFNYASDKITLHWEWPSQIANTQLAIYNIIASEEGLWSQVETFVADQYDSYWEKTPENQNEAVGSLVGDLAIVCASGPSGFPRIPLARMSRFTEHLLPGVRLGALRASIELSAEAQVASGTMTAEVGNFVKSVASENPELASSIFPEATRIVGAGGLGSVSITIGRDANQVDQAFRHIDHFGLDRNVVQEAVLNDLRPVASEIMPHNSPRSVIVDGIEVEYFPHRLPNGSIHVGRIHGFR